jgi:hypothetical protein
MAVASVVCAGVVWAVDLRSGLSRASAATIEQPVAAPVTAAVIADAPILKVGKATPLRVAAVETTLRVLSEAGDWS